MEQRIAIKKKILTIEVKQFRFCLLEVKQCIECEFEKMSKRLEDKEMLTNEQ